MFRAARGALIFMFLLVSGGMLLAGGEPPLGVLLMLVGMAMPLVTANRAMGNAGKRQGKGSDFTWAWEDLANLSTRDVMVHIASLAVGIGMMVAAATLSDTST